MSEKRRKKREAKWPLGTFCAPCEGLDGKKNCSVQATFWPQN